MPWRSVRYGPGTGATSASGAVLGSALMCRERPRRGKARRGNGDSIASCFDREETTVDGGMFTSRHGLKVRPQGHSTHSLNDMPFPAVSIHHLLQQPLNPPILPLRHLLTLFSTTRDSFPDQTSVRIPASHHPTPSPLFLSCPVSCRIL